MALMQGVLAAFAQNWRDDKPCSSHDRPPRRLAGAPFQVEYRVRQPMIPRQASAIGASAPCIPVCFAPAMKLTSPLILASVALLASCDQNQQLARSLQQQMQEIQATGRATQDLSAKMTALQAQTADFGQALVQQKSETAAAADKAARDLETRLASMIEPKLAAALKDTNARIAALEAAVKKMEMAASAPAPAPKTPEVRPAIPNEEPPKTAGAPPPPTNANRPLMIEKRPPPARERIRLSFPSSPGSASGPSMPVQAVPDPKELRGEGAAKGGNGAAPTR